MYKLLVPALILMLPLQVVAGYANRPFVTKKPFKIARPAPKIRQIEFVAETLSEESLPVYSLSTIEVGSVTDWNDLPEIEPLHFF